MPQNHTAITHCHFIRVEIFISVVHLSEPWHYNDGRLFYHGSLCIQQLLSNFSLSEHKKQVYAFSARNHLTPSLFHTHEVYHSEDLSEWTAAWWGKRIILPTTQKPPWKCESPPVCCHNDFRTMLTAPPTCHRQVKDVNTPRLFDRVRKKKGAWKEREGEKKSERMEEREWVSAVPWYSQTSSN